MYVYLISGARQSQDQNNLKIHIYMTMNRRKSLFEISINVNTNQGWSLVHPTISRSRIESSLYFSPYISPYIHIWQTLDRNVNQLHTNRGWSLWWAQQSQDRDINPRLRVGDWRPPDDVRDAFICNMTRSYVTWRIHMWHDSYVTWLIHVWRGSFTCDLTHMWNDSFTCDVPHPYVTWPTRGMYINESLRCYDNESLKCASANDSFIWVIEMCICKWLIHMSHWNAHLRMTHSYESLKCASANDSFIWVIEMRICKWLIHMSHW